MKERNVMFTETDFRILDSYKSVLDGLAAYLGDGYEIVLHSLHDLDHSVIKIINGHYTGRREGRYDCCLSYSPVIGAWRPLAGTAPYLGRMGEVCHAPELKVEVTCRTDRVEETVAAVKRAHPYEEPVINVIPLYRTGL